MKILVAATSATLPPAYTFVCDQGDVYTADGSVFVVTGDVIDPVGVGWPVDGDEAHRARTTLYLEVVLGSKNVEFQGKLPPEAVKIIWEQLTGKVSDVH